MGNPADVEGAVPLGEVKVYTAKEFAALLSTAQGPLQAIIAIGGFAGLRTEALLRLASIRATGRFLERGYPFVSGRNFRVRLLKCYLGAVEPYLPSDS